MAQVLVGKADLKPGENRCLEVKGKRLALANINGKYYCIDSLCSHAGGPLCAGKIGGKSATSVTCPLHGSVFDFKDGSVIAGPARDAMKSFPVTVKDGKAFVEM